MCHLRARLLTEIARRLPSWAISATAEQSHLTVGVEHELFLLDADRPCDHSDSEKVFTALIGEGYSPHIDDESALMFGVSANIGGGGRAWVKYEYDPSLIEISTPYFDEIDSLARCLTSVWQSLARAADRARLTLLSVPSLDVPDRISLGSRTRLKGTRLLQSFRRQLVKRHGGELSFADFPAWTAATQTQIGRLPWFGHPCLVDALYKCELKTGAVAYGRLPGPAADQFARRWEGYKEVYGKTPLLGFPDFKGGWTLEAWADGLLDAPLFGELHDSWNLQSARVLGGPPNGDWALFFDRVRDLQLVKPRLSGTLEFRADPAQPSVEAIIEVAATRLSACRDVTKGDPSNENYGHVRRQWLAQSGR